MGNFMHGGGFRVPFSPNDNIIKLLPVNCKVFVHIAVTVLKTDGCVFTWKPYVNGTITTVDNIAET